MIICAAIKVEHNDCFGNSLESIIICGHRHRDCYKILKYLDINRVSEEQGFINDEGEFLGRVGAYAEALQCGQLSQTVRWYKKDHNDDELYSEDLY